MLFYLGCVQDLLQCVEGNEGRAELQEGVDTMLAVLKCLNDSMHQVAITAFPVITYISWISFAELNLYY